MKRASGMTVLVVMVLGMTVTASWGGEKGRIRCLTDLKTMDAAPAVADSRPGSREWLRSIRPAAGDHQPRVVTVPSHQYWKQTVNRRRR